MLAACVATIVLSSFSGTLSSLENPRNEAKAKTAAKDWTGAESAWEAVTAQNPTDATAWLELGRARYMEKKYAEAMDPLQKADYLGVSYPWDMPYFQACCYALSGKKTEAFAKLKDSIDLGFRNLRDIPNDEDLKSLHDLPEYHRLVDDEDVSKLNRIDGLTHDIRFYQRELKRLDYREKYLGGTGVDHFADEFVKALPSLTDNQVMVRFMEMGALMGDGHTGIRPMHGSSDGLPIAFVSFNDGLFVTSTTPAQKDLLGAKLLAIDGHGVDELLPAVSKLFGYENSQWVLAQGPRYLRKPRCLNGLGLTPSDKSVLLKLQQDGKQKEVTLNADANDPDATWIRYGNQGPAEKPLAYRHRDKPFWYEYLPETKTVFFQYNAGSDAPDQTVADFAKELFGFVDTHDVDRMVVDTRFNGGGNNFLNQPLVLGLAASKINQRGKLFVITGKNTFSAAMCFVTQVDRYTHAIFAGEPTGSSPNFIGESIPVDLRYTHMSGSISDLYWQNSVAMDHRKWISPEIYIPATFAAYSKNQDPVMDAIMAYHE